VKGSLTEERGMDLRGGARERCRGERGKCYCKNSVEKGQPWEGGGGGNISAGENSFWNKGGVSRLKEGHCPRDFRYRPIFQQAFLGLLTPL